jgi:probable O-glycosylation ligase (exosortase A-associated)
VRDLYIALIIFGLLPAVIMRPYVGTLLWAWVSLMSPHRLSWGFSFDFPYVQVIALASFVGLLLSKEKKSFPVMAPTVFFMLFTVWVCVTTVFALSPDLAQARLIFVLKIFALAYFALITITTRERLHALVWIIVLSIGFYGVKGGVFTFVSGGGFRVYGPPGSFIEDNNQMALALVMMIPLFRYLQMNSGIKFMRVGLGFAMASSIVGALASYSRGAMLAMTVTLFALLAQTRRKILTGFLVISVALGALAFLPQDWFDRMSTLGDDEVDASTQGRFDIWAFSTEVAVSRPVVGGGFDMLFDKATYDLYGSTIKPRSAHSIVFQVLGEHGFIGLFLFLMIGISLWFKAQWIKKNAKGYLHLQWARDLASMCQVSLMGYFVAGLFLNLAFFDLIYLYVPVIVGTAAIVLRERAKAAREARAEEAPAPIRVTPVAPGHDPARPAFGARQF